jgi:hypothetical protein
MVHLWRIWPQKIKKPVKASENVSWKCFDKLLVVVGPKIQKELIWLRMQHQQSKIRNQIVLSWHWWQAVISAVRIYAVFQETQYCTLFPGMGVFDHVRCCLSVIPTERIATLMHSNSLKSKVVVHIFQVFIKNRKWFIYFAWNLKMVFAVRLKHA